MAVRYLPQLAVEFPDGWPVEALQGAEGTVVYAGGDTPANITEDQDGSVAIPGSRLRVSSQNMVPGFWLQGLASDELEFVSGAYRVPLLSLAAVRRAADDARTSANQAVAEAEQARQAAEDAAANATSPTALVVNQVLTNPDSGSRAVLESVVGGLVAEGTGAVLDGTLEGSTFWGVFTVGNEPTPPNDGRVHWGFRVVE